MIRFKKGGSKEDIQMVEVKRRRRGLTSLTQIIFREILNFIPFQQCFEAIIRVVTMFREEERSVTTEGKTKDRYGVTPGN